MEDYLTTKQVAVVLGVSRVRAWQLIKEGVLDATFVGGIWLVTPKVVRDYIAQKKTA